MTPEVITPDPAETRRLAAIMFSDMVGFSSQMGANEARLMRLLEVHNVIVERLVAEHHGRVVKTLGDAFVVEFPSVVHAVQSAQGIQQQLREYNAKSGHDEQIHLRIGIHLGDVIEQHGDVFGDGVNIAARLQSLAEPDTICISQAVYQEVAQKLPRGTILALGRPKLKNIVQRMPVYVFLHEKPSGLRLRLHYFLLQARYSGVFQRTLAAVLLLIAATAGGLAIRSYWFPSPQGTGEKPSIVVLPFDNMSSDPEQEYFSDGICEDITTDLSKISGLMVISRNSAFTYKGKKFDVRDVGREMGVRYVLEGSVRRMGDEVRITAQLIDAVSNDHLWADRYDVKRTELFDVQDQIVRKIVTTLKLQLDQGALISRTTENMEAYDDWLRGMEALNRFSKVSNKEAQKWFQKATELDPNYAEAYARLSWTYWLDWWWYSGTDADLEKARELAEKAVALDDTLSIAHASLSYVYLFKKDHAQAVEEAQRAVAVDPNFAGGYHALADMLCFAGREEESLGQMETAMKLNPRYPVGYLNSLGFAQLVQGKRKEAVKTLKLALERNADFMSAHVTLAVAYSELDQMDAAAAEVKQMLRLSPTVSQDSVRRKLPFQDPSRVQRWVDALGKAGLRETVKKP